MTDGLDSLPPRKRARARLQALIKGSDDRGNASAFDPWPLAELYSRLHADASEENWRTIQPLMQPLGQACAAAEEAWTGSHMRRPRMQVHHAEMCLKMRREIEAGAGSAVMEAVSICASHGILIPGWLAAEFVKRYERVVEGECKGWGDKDAFGSVVPKGWNVAGLKARTQDAPWAYEVALTLLEENSKRPLDRGFYEAVGETIGCGKSRAESLIEYHVEPSTRFYAPLAYVKAGLLNGKELGQVLIAWTTESREKFKPDSDGKSGNAPSLTRKSKGRKTPKKS